MMNPLVRQAAEDVASHERRLDRMAALQRLEREYLALRQMTPRDAAAFFDGKRDRAAARLQGAWRGARARRTLGALSAAVGAARRERAVTVIQRIVRRRRRARRHLDELRAEREGARAGLLLELPLIQQRIVSEAGQFRLREASSAAELTRQIERTLADWAELRQRSAIKTTQRQSARAEARAIHASLQAARAVDPDCSHAEIAHLRPLARRGAEAPPAPEHARLHRAMSGLARLDADAAAARERAAADAAGRPAARASEPGDAAARPLAR